MTAYFLLFIFLILELIMAVLTLITVPLSVIAGLFGSGKFKKWGVNNLHALDNFRSAQLLGDPEETISSRLGKARDKGSKWGAVADAVDLVALDLFNDPNHCDKAKELSEGSKQLSKY